MTDTPVVATGESTKALDIETLRLEQVDDEPGRAMLRQIVEPVMPEPCPGGCACRWREDADRHDCGCDGPCTGPTGEFDPEWESRPDVPDDPEDVLYSLDDLRSVLGRSDLSLEQALAAAASVLRSGASR